MSKTKYCDEGQNEASIVVDGIAYVTSHPPLFVEVGVYIPQFIAWRWKVFSYVTLSNTVIPGTEYNSLSGYTLYRDAIGDFIPRPWAIIRSDTREIIYEIPSFQGYPSEIIVEQKPAQYDAIKATDSTGKTLASFPFGTLYTINCDGCGVGECKGKKASYPGYDCLDCLRMQQQLKRIGKRIDGITNGRRN